jgi:Fe-S cluster assembly protein SufD
LLKQLNGTNDARRIAMRDRAMSFFKETGFPTTKEEAWRFTDIKPITSQVFNLSKKIEVGDSLKLQISERLFKNWQGLQLVFIDGQYQGELSLVDKNLPENVVISDFKSLPKENQNRLTSIIEKSPAKIDNAFTAMNSAFLHEGAWIEIPDNLNEKINIHILHFSTALVKNSVSLPRIYVKVGKNSSSYLIESHFGVDDQTYFSNIVADIELAENARLNHCKIQAESQSSFHMAHTYVHQSKHSEYQSCLFMSGAAIVRNNIHVILEGEQCETGLDGLYLGHKNQLMDNQTYIDHAQPHCHSREVYRGILADRAHGIFSGKIMVRPDAQKTDAEQSNSGLLLSEEAKIDTKPQLEIYADDVKCTHGATVGQLDEEAMFYLQSRGIGQQKARNMLIYAFAEEIVENITDEQVKDTIEKLILTRLEDDMQFEKNGAV